MSTREIKHLVFFTFENYAWRCRFAVEVSVKMHSVCGVLKSFDDEKYLAITTSEYVKPGTYANPRFLLEKS